MKMWEIREGEYSHHSRDRYPREDEFKEETSYEEAYEEGYQAGYRAASREHTDSYRDRRYR